MQNIQIKWDDAEQSILYAGFVDKWTWDDYHHAVMQGFAMARNVSHRVDIIAEMKTNIPLPNGSAMTHLNHVSQTQPKNVIMIVLVTQNRFVQMINEVFFKINAKAREAGAVTGSVEEARRLIAARRAQQSGAGR